MGGERNRASPGRDLDYFGVVNHEFARFERTSLFCRLLEVAVSSRVKRPR